MLRRYSAEHCNKYYALINNKNTVDLTTFQNRFCAIQRSRGDRWQKLYVGVALFSFSAVGSLQVLKTAVTGPEEKYFILYSVSCLS